MQRNTAVGSMAFAETVSSSNADNTMVGYASVDVTEFEAERILAGLPNWPSLTGPPSASDLVMPTMEDASIEGVLHALDGRYLAWAECERQGPLAAASSTLAHLQMHRSKWIREYPLLKVICEDCVTMRKLDACYKSMNGGDAGDLLASADARWAACRLSGPFNMKVAASSQALQLAQVVAKVAVEIAATKAVRYLNKVECTLHDSLVRHSSGNPEVYRQSGWDSYHAWYAGPYSEMVCRALDYEAAVAAEDLPRTLRVGIGIDGSELADCRDRLLFKMLGRNVPANTALGLRIENVHVDVADTIYHASDTGWVPFYGLDVCGEDLLALVRANGGSEGFLFAVIDGGLPYGSRALNSGDVEAVFTARSQTAGLNPGDVLEGMRSSIGGRNAGATLPF